MNTASHCSKGTTHYSAGFLPAASEAHGRGLKCIPKEGAKTSECLQSMDVFWLLCNRLVFLARATGRIWVGCKGEPLSWLLEEARWVGNCVELAPLGAFRTSHPAGAWGSPSPSHVLRGFSSEPPYRQRWSPSAPAGLVQSADSMTPPP